MSIINCGNSFQVEMKTAELPQSSLILIQFPFYYSFYLLNILPISPLQSHRKVENKRV